jgi:very-short-patch-repair endonuclease
MPIKCKICQKDFINAITASHLKSHGITIKEYTDLYGKDSLYSEEYKLKLAEIAKSNVKKREEKYLIIGKRPDRQPLSEETKQKISDSIKKYSQNNHEELSQRAYKAIQTKRDSGKDLAFFRGKKHTEENKELFKKQLNQNILHKQLNSYNNIQGKLDNLELSCDNLKNNTLSINCNKCQTTFQITKQYFYDCKFHHEICPTCYPRNFKTSNAQIEIYDFLKSFNIDCVLNKQVGKYQADILSEKHKIIIEYDGLYWHSEQVLDSINKSKFKSLDKMKFYNSLGYECITIFEDEWKFNSEIVKSRLLSIFKQIKKKIHARECVVREISSRDANKFLNQHHLQGSGRSNVRLGAFFNNQLVAVMTFTNSSPSRKVKQIELDRFASIKNHIINGIASKMFKYFIKKYEPDSVVTYSNRRWGGGTVYKNMGFKFDSETKPSYWYFKPNEGKRIHRYTLRKNKNDDQTKTEVENRLEQGYYRIWDCGNYKWVWKKEGA